MAITELEPQGEPRLPQITIWQVYEDGEAFHQLVIDGTDKGRIDWEENLDGTRAAIDGLDAEAELGVSNVRQMAWLSIAACMSEIHPAVAEIQHLDGTIHIGEGFLAVPTDEDQAE